MHQETNRIFRVNIPLNIKRWPIQSSGLAVRGLIPIDYDYTPWMCQWMTGNSLVNCSILCWADSIASAGAVLILSFSKNNNDHMCCEIQRKGCHILTMHMNTHTHTHTVSFTSSRVSQIRQSKCLFRPKMTGVQDRGSDVETRPPGFTHCCPSLLLHLQATFSTIIQHFSTSAPFWPTLNITFIKWYVQADYIVDGLMLVIFTDLYLSSKDILMCFMAKKVIMQKIHVVLKHTWIYGWCL